jgi:hypothetical protein
MDAAMRQLMVWGRQTVSFATLVKTGQTKETPAQRKELDAVVKELWLAALGECKSPGIDRMTLCYSRRVLEWVRSQDVVPPDLPKKRAAKK